MYQKDNLSIIVLANLSGASPESFVDDLAIFYIPSMKKSAGNAFLPTVNSLRNVLEKSGYMFAIEEAKKNKHTI